MHCCLWFRSVFRVRGPWPKRYGYHLSNILLLLFIFSIIFLKLVSVQNIIESQIIIIINKIKKE